MARVLLVGKGLPDRGGIASFLRILLESSLSEDHDVSFLNIAHADVPQGGRFTIANVTRTTRDAVSVWRAARGRDVVHIHSGAGSPVTIMRAGVLATAGRLRGCRVIVHAHGGRIQLWLTTRPRRAFARFVLRPANVVIAVSQGTRDALEGSVPAGRLLLIENGIVVDDFGPPELWHTPPRLALRRDPDSAQGFARPARGVREICVNEVSPTRSTSSGERPMRDLRRRPRYGWPTTGTRAVLRCPAAGDDGEVLP